MFVAALCSDSSNKCDISKMAETLQIIFSIYFWNQNIVLVPISLKFDYKVQMDKILESNWKHSLRKYFWKCHIQNVCLAWGSTSKQIQLSLLTIWSIILWCNIDSVNKLGKNIYTGPTYKLLLSIMVISYIYRSFIPNKAHLISTVLLGGFQRSCGALISTD